MILIWNVIYVLLACAANFAFMAATLSSALLPFFSDSSAASLAASSALWTASFTAI